MWVKIDTLESKNQRDSFKRARPKISVIESSTFNHQIQSNKKRYEQTRSWTYQLKSQGAVAAMFLLRRLYPKKTFIIRKQRISKTGLLAQDFSLRRELRKWSYNTVNNGRERVYAVGIFCMKEYYSEHIRISTHFAISSLYLSLSLKALSSFTEQDHSTKLLQEKKENKTSSTEDDLWAVVSDRSSIRHVLFSSLCSVFFVLTFRTSSCFVPRSYNLHTVG